MFLKVLMTSLLITGSSFRLRSATFYELVLHFLNVENSLINNWSGRDYQFTIPGVINFTSEEGHGRHLPISNLSLARAKISS